MKPLLPDKLVKIGVVLSSGGGRGVFAHTGFLMALEQLGVEISAIAGCSAGAIVGGIYASGRELDDWAKTLANVDVRQYWTPDNWLTFCWKMGIKKGRGYTGLSDTRSAKTFIESQLVARFFNDCHIPFECLATNLSKGEKTLFSSGSLAPRIMASAAIPILYRPVEINGEYFCDGATIELASTEAICCKYQLDVLLVHHTSVYGKGKKGFNNAMRKPWTLVEMLSLLLYQNRPWYLSDQELGLRHCRCGCGAPVVVLEPELPELEWPMSQGGINIQKKAIRKTLHLLSGKLEKLGL